MKYTLYINFDCHHCPEVAEYVANNDVNCRVVHVTDDNEEPPMELFVFPALMEGNRLIHYGIEIIDFLKAQK